METVEQNLKLFRDLVICNRELYLWSYDSEMNLVDTNCTNIENFSLFFQIAGFSDWLCSIDENHRKPWILTDSIGVVWLADFERKNGELYRIHILGPTLVDDLPLNNMDLYLEQRNISAVVKRELMEILKDIPVIPITSLYEYGVMLHFCITGQRITFYDFDYAENEPVFQKTKEEFSASNPQGTYAAEQRILQLVRDGNLNYMEQMGRLVNIGKTGRVSTKDVSRQLKNLCIVFITMCTRAAMEGGVDPETAYSLSDYYIQRIEDARYFSEITEITNTMQGDFIHRVHLCKTNSGISSEIQACCDYIIINLEKNLSIQDIARRVGYTPNYLGRKFKKEIGYTIGDYIHSKKMEYAKALLRDKRMSIQDVSERLGYCSGSYFSEMFRRYVKLSPTEYLAQFEGKSNS